MASLAQQLRDCPLGELLEVGLRCARQLQTLYRDWPDAKVHDIAVIDDTLAACEASIGRSTNVECLEDLCETAYLATGRAAAAFRLSKSIEARLAAFAGTAAYAIADAVADRLIDAQTSRTNAMLAVDAAYKARKLIESVEQSAAAESQS